MKIPVSTKVEKAWYVDPEKYVKEAEEAAKPINLTQDVEVPRNDTFTLGDGDLEPAPELKVPEEEALRLENEALEGAIIAPDEPAEPEAVPPQVAIARPTGPGLGPTLAKGISGAVKVLSRATVVLEIFEEGKLPPIWLAAIAFFAGVITTLIGVLLAL
jgi:hypothetical protein